MLNIIIEQSAAVFDIMLGITVYYNNVNKSFSRNISIL